MGRFVLVMRPMPFGHGAFSFLHGAFWFWSWGVLPPYWEGQRPRCPIRRHTGNEDVAPPVRLNHARSSVKWGCALRVVERQPLFCDSVVKDQIGSFLCHFPSAKHTFKASVACNGREVLHGTPNAPKKLCFEGKPRSRRRAHERSEVAARSREGGTAFRRVRPPIALAITSRPYTGR